MARALHKQGGKAHSRRPMASRELERRNGPAWCSFVYPTGEVEVLRFRERIQCV